MPYLGCVVDERRVHAGRHALGELGDDLRVQRVIERADDDAVLAVGRALAREHQELAFLVGHDVVDHAGVRLHRVDDDRLRGIADVDGVEPVAAEVGAEIRDFAVGMNPDFGGGKCLPHHRADDRRRPAHLAPPDGHLGRGGAAAQGRRDGVGARLVGDERAVVVDVALARTERP